MLAGNASQVRDVGGRFAEARCFDAAGRHRRARPADGFFHISGAGIALAAAITIGCFGLLGLALRSGGLALAGTRMRRIGSALGWLGIAMSSLILLLGLLMLDGGLGRLL